MRCGRRGGEFGVALLLGTALAVSPPGCSRKPSGSAGGSDSGAKGGGTKGGMVMEGPKVERITAPRPVSDLDSDRANNLYMQARSAWLAGQCGNAIRLAQKANALRHSNRHVGLIGACACSLGRPQQARWAYDQLSGGQQNMLLQVCRSKGIELK
ncbi:MAG: hypothetical protein ABI333_00460 [bacterium]